MRIELKKFHDGQTNIYKGLGQFTLLRCGRRFGKTTMLEQMACNWGLRGLKVGWFCPDYKRLMPSYKRIHKTTLPMVETASKIDALIQYKNEGLVEFWTLGDEDAGRSRDYDWVIIDEASLVKRGMRDIWEQAIAPTLLDRNGRAIMAGTPKGVDPDNFFYEVSHGIEIQDPQFADWKEFHAPTMANPTLSQEAVAKLKDKYPPLVYRQEYLAEFVDWSGDAFFGLQKLLVDGAGVPYPAHSDAVFATIDTAVKTGSENDSTAVCFWAKSSLIGHPLVLLDWDILQIEGSLLEHWLPSVNQRLDELAIQCGARFGNIGSFIEDKASGTILLQQALRRGMKAHAIDSKLTAMGKDERAISVSGYVHREMVKLSEYAYNKQTEHKKQVRNHFVSQFVGYRIGVKDQADDALDAGCYGIAIALGNAEGF